MSRTRAGEVGSATVELAIALPAVVLALVAIVTVVVVGVARIDVEDAARVATREAALGASDAEVSATARRLAGSSAAVRVEHSRDWVTVSVGRDVLGLSTSWQVSAALSTRTEASLLGLSPSGAAP